MLILTRRVGEALFIGDDIEVAVLGVKGNQVRVGVHAPEDVTVLREELLDRVYPPSVVEPEHSARSGND